MRATTRIRNANKTKQVRWFQYLHVIHLIMIWTKSSIKSRPLPFIEIYGRPSEPWVCARFNLQTKRFDGAFKDRQIAINGHSLRLVHIKFNYLGSTNYFAVRPNHSRCCFYHETIENQIKLRPFRLLFQPMVALEICLDKSTALINIRLLHLPTHTLFPYHSGHHYNLARLFGMIR